MKKIIILSGYFVFLAVISFAGGVFVAKIKMKQESLQVARGDSSEEVMVAVENDALKEFSNMTKKTDSGNISPDAIAQVGNEVEAEDTVFSFALLGDTQYFKPGIPGSFQAVVASIKKLNPDAVFSLGDLVSSCDGKNECEEKYDSWKNIMGALLARTYPTQGNHDRTGGEKADIVWQKAFELPTNGPDGYSEFVYSFDRENSHFIVLNSEKPKENVISKDQREWLEQDLTTNKKENIFVFFHEPAFPMNSKIGEGLDAKPQERDALWAILEKNKVTAVFVGHEHIQARRKIGEVYQFTFGNAQSADHEAPKSGMAEYFHIGAGFGMVELEGRKITVKTYDAAGELLDSFELRGER